MKQTSLVIMAAGIGSRFGGGIKQLEPVGPNGEIIMDYSIHDALEAGFNKIIFIIRKDLEKDFKEIIGNRIEKVAPVEYAFQEMDDLPEGFTVPEGRKKPWGTGQAVLAARNVIHEPFLVINADDYYGKEGFKKIHDYMVNEMDEDGDCYDMCMAGFILSNTLSENGGVTRGVATVDENGCLAKVTETYDIYQDADGMHASDNDGNPVTVEAGQHVSMNMFGLPMGFLKELEKAGCHVIYGLVGLKTHSKITLVVRREEDGIRRYVHLGTGNYNDSTARLYTDCGIMTCHPEIGEDATAVFNMLSGYSEPLTWNAGGGSPVAQK